MILPILYSRENSISSATSSVISTADSFKSWNTCQDNTTCKIVSWVGIGLAILLCLWILIGLVRCLCMGLGCIAGTCCCCLACCGDGYCNSGNRNRGGRRRDDMEDQGFMMNDKQYGYVGQGQPQYNAYQPR